MLFRFIKTSKYQIIVVELIRDNTEYSFCRTLVSHDISFMTKIFGGLLQIAAKFILLHC